MCLVLDGISSWTLSSEDLLLLNPDGCLSESGISTTQNINSDPVFGDVYPSRRGSVESGCHVDSSAKWNWNSTVHVSSAASKQKQIGASTNENCGFCCPQCGKVYRWKKSLNLHLKYECGKEPQFQCPYCFVKAKRNWHLKQHI